MRFPGDRKARGRAEIVAAAGRLFRAEGFAATGVDGLMKGAGRTAGTFYSYFSSKNSLFGAVLAASIEETQSSLLAGLEGLSGDAWVAEVARRYLSRAHRDDPAQGCAMPGLAAEVGRAPEETRALFEDHVKAFVARIAENLGETTGATPLSEEDRALALVALFVGGIVLARAVKSKGLSDRILLAARRFATR